MADADVLAQTLDLVDHLLQRTDQEEWSFDDRRD